MIPEEEIRSNMIDMGYILPSVRHVFPSYYKLGDGTVLKVVVHLNYLLPNPLDPNGFSINATNIFSTFVPKEMRKPEAFTPRVDLNTGIINEDVEFDVLQENFTVYDLSNNMVLSIKPVVGQIKKTKFYTREGEPIYSVSINPVMKIKKK